MIELHDGTKASKKKLIDLCSRGRERIRLRKNDWLIEDGWIDGAEARHELLKLYAHLLKADGHRIEIIPVDRAIYEAENITDQVPDKFDEIFFRMARKSNRIHVDAGNSLNVDN